MNMFDKIDNMMKKSLLKKFNQLVYKFNEMNFKPVIVEKKSVKFKKDIEEKITPELKKEHLYITDFYIQKYMSNSKIDIIKEQMKEELAIFNQKEFKTILLKRMRQLSFDEHLFKQIFDEIKDKISYVFIKYFCTAIREQARIQMSNHLDSCLIYAKFTSQLFQYLNSEQNKLILEDLKVFLRHSIFNFETENDKIIKALYKFYILYLIENKQDEELRHLFMSILNAQPHSKMTFIFIEIFLFSYDLNQLPDREKIVEYINKHILKEIEDTSIAVRIKKAIK